MPIHRHYRLFGKIERNRDNHGSMAIPALRVLVLSLLGSTLPLIDVHTHGTPLAYGVGALLLWSVDELLNWYFDFPLLQARMVTAMLLSGVLLAVELAH